MAPLGKCQDVKDEELTVPEEMINYNRKVRR